MKKLLLFSFGFLFSFNALNAQVPPPPCGLSPVFVCDSDEDGEVIVDLTEKFPFNYCNVNPNQAPNYVMTYYLTEDDATNATNVIVDPENYLFANEEEEIFRRADAISSSTVLIASDGLIMVIPPTPNTPSPLIACDANADGFEEFNLYDKNAEIRSGQSATNYQIDYYQSFNDAVNLVNRISNPTDYTNVVQGQQTIYASISVMLENNPALACVEVVELDLIVQDDCQDLAVYLFNPGPSPRPGFSFDNVLYIENNGAQIIPTGTVVFEYDSNLLFNTTSTSSSSAVITNTAAGFNVDFLDLDVGESIEIDINFTCPVSVPLGTLLSNIATYTTTTEDVNDSNDVFELRETVIGAYDPNDKMESHGPEIIYNDFVASNEYLYYTIRFQNVGTAEAIDVRIEDVLDSQLNPSTFDIISWSHPNTVLREGDKLTWSFPNINLPAEQDDPEGSNGYVLFRVKPNSGYAIGDIIPNNASIFFDFNAPIVTNTFETEFIRDGTLGTIDSELSVVNLFPNPSNGMVQINMNQYINMLQLNVFDIQGKLVYNLSEINSERIEIDLTSLRNGMYFIELSNNESTIVEKIFIN